MTVDGLSILVMLAFGIAVFLLTAFLAPYITAAIPINRYWPRFCQILCDLRALLGFIFGIAVGLFLCMCWRLIADMLGSDIWCIRILCLLLLIAFLLAFIYAWAAACCPGLQGKWRPASGNWFALILLLLALLLLAFLIYVGGQALETIRSTHCARLLLIVILIGLLVLFLRALGCRYCTDPVGDVVRVAVSIDRERCALWVTILGYLLALLLILIVWLIWYCRHDLEAKFELAMVGIWWDGKYGGDKGAHLRWAFDEPLPFPQNGFDLYRRESSGGSWVKLNAPGPIFPSTTWSGPGDPTRWIDRGVDRLPAVVHPRYEGANTENFDHLQEMLAYPNLYASLFYVEGIDAPFTNQTLADQAADAAPEPVARWDISPMALLQTIALHSEVARLLGLYYIDPTADPNVEYDYRIVGHWLDRDRFYEVKQISGPNTVALAPPVLQKADALPDSTKPVPGGGWWPTEARVALRWDPPTADPNASFGPADGIRPVFQKIQRRDVGPALGPLTPPGPYEAVTVPDDAGQFAPMDPVVAQPEELPNNTLVWPDYFAYDAWVDYRTYDYVAVGIDVFGRESLPSPEKRVSVLDTVAPPPPLNIEATIYQRADPEVGRLRQAEREKLFPAGSDNEYAIRVGWIWTDALRVRYPDLKAFRIFYRFTNFDSFSLPANRANWPITTQYEAQLGAAKDVADAEPAIPARYSDPSSPTGFVFPAAENPADSPADYYEEVFTTLDPAFITLITADDNPTVKYGFMTVAGMDHDPFNNVGQGATPVTVFSRDFIPPPRPPAPVLHAAPGEADRAGNVNLTMRVDPATDIYRYVFSRVARSQLTSIPDPGSLPSGCVAIADPDQATQQRKATAAGAPLRQVNAISIVPATPPSGPPNADLVDGLDATVGSTQIYVSYAIDPAGNKSEASCPAIPVQIIDRVAPRRPVVTKAVGADGAIALTWSGNREADLSRYLVYRTAEEERLSSKRRMQIVLDANPTGISQDPSLAAEDATPEAVAGETRFNWNDRAPIAGTTYYYRIVAEDESDNASEPSIPVSARALDLTPPVAPTWPATGAIALQPDADGIDRVTLTWQEAVDEPGLSYLVRRRVVGDVPWVIVSTWIEDPPFTDARSSPDISYEYQVRAMDVGGNRSDWSESRTSPP